MSIGDKPSHPNHIGFKMTFWMFVVPYFISRTVSDFLVPCGYWQAVMALWSVVLTARLMRPWIPVPYYTWYYDRPSPLPSTPDLEK